MTSGADISAPAKMRLKQAIWITGNGPAQQDPKRQQL